MRDLFSRLGEYLAFLLLGLAYAGSNAGVAEDRQRLARLHWVKRLSQHQLRRWGNVLTGACKEIQRLRVRRSSVSIHPNCMDAFVGERVRDGVIGDAFPQDSTADMDWNK